MFYFIPCNFIIFYRLSLGPTQISNLKITLTHSLSHNRIKELYGLSDGTCFFICLFFSVIFWCYFLFPYFFSLSHTLPLSHTHERTHAHSLTHTHTHPLTLSLSNPLSLSHFLRSLSLSLSLGVMSYHQYIFVF